MKTIIATALALSAMTAVSFAQQTPAPAAAATPPAPQTAPAIPSPTAVPEVMAPKDNPPPPPPAREGPPPREANWGMRGHRDHMPPPPPPSKAAHFRIRSGSTMIDIKCAEDEPTKVCADVLSHVMDKLAPSSNSDYDSDSDD